MKRFTAIAAAMMFGLILMNSAQARKSCRPTACAVKGTKACASKAQYGYMKNLRTCKLKRARCYSWAVRSCKRRCGGRAGRSYRCYRRCHQKRYRACYRRNKKCVKSVVKSYKRARRACHGTQVCCDKGYGERSCGVCVPPRTKKSKRKLARKGK